MKQQDIPPVPSSTTEELRTADEESSFSNLPPPDNRTFSVNSFIIEDSFYRSRLPKPVHWSVAWSDLMMTMFILFLTMFVYQASHEKFLVSDEPEIIGGSTTDALDIVGNNDIIIPIVPLSQKATIRPESIDEIEKIDIENLNIDEVFRDNVVFVEPPIEAQTNVEPTDNTEQNIANKQIPPRNISEDIVEPTPLSTSEDAPSTPRHTDNLGTMYDASKKLLSDGKLDKFASIDLVRDNTMRIILTGDLLFYTGQANLSKTSRKSLMQVATVIRNTPYMINVIGHTDNQPMHSSRFASNWELSVVRASSVARFLIDETGMDPKQFIVSGFGSNRPRKPNTNVLNRAINRRVEIVISKRLPPATKVTSNNLL